MKLLIERTENIEHLVENTIHGKKYYIEGAFTSYDTLNENKRIYSKRVMENAVSVYKRDYIDQRKALAEADHPPNRPMPNIQNASHLILSLEDRPSTKHYVGKAIVLETPMGQILKALIDANVNFGVSTRGLGSVMKVESTTQVQDDFRMFAIDAVTQPSGSGCTVQGLQEGTDWKLVNGEWIQEVSEVLVDIHKKKINEAVAIKQFNTLIEMFKQTS